VSLSTWYESPDRHQGQEDSNEATPVGSTAVGVMLLTGNLGGAVVVAALGALQQAAGHLRAASALTSGLAVVIALLALTIPDPLCGTGQRNPVA
jgi:hypothetical protein